MDESMSNLSPSFILCFFAVPIAMVTSTNKAPSSYHSDKYVPSQLGHSDISRCFYEKKTMEWKVLEFLSDVVMIFR